jgi:nitroreductase
LKLKKQLENPFYRFVISLAVGKKIVQAYRYHLPAIADRFNAVIEGTWSLFYGAPAVVIAHGSGLKHLAAANCNLAVMEILLAAETMRLGTCYNGYALTAILRDKEVRRFSTVPKGYTPGGVFAVGEPEVMFRRVPPRRRPRITWR